MLSNGLVRYHGPRRILSMTIHTCKTPISSCIMRLPSSIILDSISIWPTDILMPWCSHTTSLVVSSPCPMSPRHRMPVHPPPSPSVNHPMVQPSGLRPSMPFHQPAVHLHPLHPSDHRRRSRASRGACLTAPLHPSSPRYTLPRRPRLS